MSSILRLLPMGRVVAAAVIAVLLLADPAMAADPLSTFEVTADDQVIYCSIGPVHTGERIRQALSEGTTVSFIWEISVEEISTYWLNDNVGTVTIVRQVVPDLISRSWTLIDVNSGISHQTYRLDEAVKFLSELNHFPALDRSLLTSGTAYNFSIDLRIQEGELSDAWWSGLFKFSKQIAQADVILP